MKKILLLFLILISLISSAQEEFFGKHNGLSIGYGQSLNEQTKFQSVALGVFFNQSISFGAGLGQFNDRTNLTIGLAYFTGKRRPENEVKNYIGVTYSSIEEINIAGLTVGAYKVFLSETKFPFSLNMSFIAQMAFQESQWETNYRMVPLFSFVFRQAFFATNGIYPVAGIGANYNIDTSRFLYSATAGLNIKINND